MSFIIVIYWFCLFLDGISKYFLNSCNYLLNAVCFSFVSLLYCIYYDLSIRQVITTIYLFIRMKRTSIRIKKYIVDCYYSL